MNTSRRFKTAFIIDDVALRQLDRILERVSSKRTYEVEMKRGISEKVSTVTGVSNLPNSKTEPIQSIKAVAVGDKTSASVKIESNTLLGTVSFHVDADEATSLLITRRLEEWLREITPWYSLLATINFVLFVPIAFLVFLLIVSIFYLIMLAQGYTPSEPASTNTATSNALGNVMFVMVFVLGILLNVLRSTIFPVATFSIGYGVKRHRNAEKLREFLGLTIIVGIMVNIAAGLLLR